MQPLKNLMQRPLAVEKKRSPNSERADLIGEVLVLMGEHTQQKGESAEAFKQRTGRRFKYWLGRTRKLPPSEIYRLLRLARDGTRPPALFNHLLKTYGKPEAQK